VASPNGKRDIQPPSCFLHFSLIILRHPPEKHVLLPVSTSSYVLAKSAKQNQNVVVGMISGSPLRNGKCNGCIEDE